MMYPLPNMIPGYSLPAIGFSARMTRDAYLGDGQAVKYNDVISNYGGGYNRWTGHFTAPLKGLYLFSCTIMADRGSYLHIEIVKNGKRIGAVHSNTSHWDQGSQTVVVGLRKGDHVWTRQYYLGRHLHDNVGYNMFTGVLISRNIGFVIRSSNLKA